MKKRVLVLGMIGLLCVLWNTCIALAAREPDPEYYIEISINHCRLLFYKKQGESLTLFKEYPVATPKKGLDVFPLGPGYVTRIEFDPIWSPTAYTRQYFKERKQIDLPKRVPAGDPLNYMGAVKIFLSHQTSKGDIYRIHGNNDETQVGKRATGGCTRMHNEDGVELAKLIKVGTEVNIVP